MIIGIDLGTTNSLAAVMSDDGPRLIPNALGDLLTPSVVGLDRDGHVLVGRAAQELQVTAPDRCASLFKRQMGSEWTAELAGQPFTPVELSSLVLKSLREDAAAHLGEPVERAVITVPAYFNEHQRTATIRAGEIAGLTVERIVNEPTAAAIAYGLHEADEEKIALIFDLGGGTFDVSIVDLFAGTLEIRSSSGETFLGGEDFTNTITAEILKRAGIVFEQAEHKTPLLVARLRHECEAAKRKLTTTEETVVRIPDENGESTPDSRTETGHPVRVPGLDATCAGSSRTAIATCPRRHRSEAIGCERSCPGRRRDSDAGSGFSCQRDVRHRAPQQPRPDHVVVLGAAIQAALIAKDSSVDDLVVTDVAPFTLGVETTREIGGMRRNGYFMPILNRNTTIRVSRLQRVQTLEPNQTSVNVHVFQGESRMVSDNLPIADFEVTGIPPGPPGQEIDIRFTYDLNGVLEIEAVVVETQKKVSHVVTRYAKGLSKSDIDAAVRNMQKLKTHPRDETENRYVLRWADRLYRELPLDLREQLDMLLTGFETSMEEHDKETVARHREALQQFLSAFDTDSDAVPEDEDGV